MFWYFTVIRDLNREKKIGLIVDVHYDLGGINFDQETGEVGLDNIPTFYLAVYFKTVL